MAKTSPPLSGTIPESLDNTDVGLMSWSNSIRLPEASNQPSKVSNSLEMISTSKQSPGVRPMNERKSTGSSPNTKVETVLSI